MLLCFKMLSRGLRAEVWIGLKKEDKLNGWQWSDGSPWHFNVFQRKLPVGTKQNLVYWNTVTVTGERLM